MMSIFHGTLTSKGQTTVPSEVREILNLKPGDKIRYVVQGDRVYLRVKNRKIGDLAGILHVAGRRPMSPEDMDQAIADRAVDDDKRIVNDWNRHEHSS